MKFLQGLIELKSVVIETPIITSDIEIYPNDVLRSMLVPDNAKSLVVLVKNNSTSTDGIIDIFCDTAGDQSPIKEQVIPYQTKTAVDSSDVQSLGYGCILVDNIPTGLNIIDIKAKDAATATNVQVINARFLSKTLQESLIAEDMDTLIYTRNSRNYSKKYAGKSLIGVFQSSNSYEKTVVISKVNADAVVTENYGRLQNGIGQLTYNNSVYYIGFGTGYAYTHDDIYDSDMLNNHIYFGKYNMVEEEMTSLDGTTTNLVDTFPELLQYLLPIADQFLNDTVEG